MMLNNKKSNKNKPTKPILMLITLIAVMVLILLNFEEFKRTLNVISNSETIYIYLGTLLVLLTFIFSSFSYYALKHKHISYSKIFIIQIASGFANKLLPAGVGGLALNTRFFVKQRHSLPQAVSTITVNNFMGLLAHITLLLIIASVTNYSFSLLPEIKGSVLIVLLLFLCLVILTFRVLATFSKKVYKKIEKITNSLVLAFKFYSKKPYKLVLSYLASFFLTASYFSCLYFCLKAIGVDISLMQVGVVFSAGVIFGAISPTPGGVGGAELALAASLVATGTEVTNALSVALLFRLLTYWLPIIPGFIAFQFSVKKNYI